MPEAVPFQPPGFHTATPYLRLKRGVEALAFYQKALNATEVSRLIMADGRLGHAEIRIGDSAVMLADEFPEMGAKGPGAYGGSPVHLHLYVVDADAFFEKAIAAGATVLRPLADQFYGDRSGTITDPFGHVWHIATHKEDVPPDEIKRRADKLHGAK